MAQATERLVVWVRVETTEMEEWSKKDKDLRAIFVDISVVHLDILPFLQSN